MQSCEHGFPILMRPVKVAILGTPVTSGNRGVLALGSSLVNLCLEAVREGQIVLMLGCSNNQPAPFRIAGKLTSVPVVNWRLSPRSRLCDHLVWIVFASLLYRALPITAFRRTLRRLTPWIDALEGADVVGDVHGGDSFSDIYGMRRFLLGFLGAWTVILVKGTIVQFPQTIGPFRSLLARRLARYILKNSRIVIARDEMSQRVAQELIGLNPKVWLSPDVAFSLETVRPEHIELDPPLLDPVPSGVIGLNVNGLMANGGYTRENMFNLSLDYRKLLPELVKALLAEHAGELWLVPHTYAHSNNPESDPEACRSVRHALPKELQHRVRLIACEYDQHQIKGIIGQCDFFIGSRMHACIAALSQGVPCVGIAYSMKFEGVFDTVGMHGWVVDGREVTNEQAIARVVELYRERDMVRDTLIANVNRSRARLIEVFQSIFSNAPYQDRSQ